MLENQGGNATSNSHWDRRTVLDDFMTGSEYWGNRITPITLMLFKDSGYFYDVDMSLADNIEFGKNKGCDFARGRNTDASPEYCTSTFTPKGYYEIDFYRFFGGRCATNSLSD